MTTSQIPEFENIPEGIRKGLEEGDGWSVVRELDGKLERLNQYQIDAIFSAIRGLSDLGARGKAIELVAPKLFDLSDEHGLTLLHDLESLVRDDPDFSARSMRSILPELDEEGIDRVYKTSQELNASQARLILLTGLIGYVSDDKKPQIASDLYRLANEVEDPELGAATLIALYPLVPSDLKPDVYQRAQESIYSLTLERQPTMFAQLAQVVENGDDKERLFALAISSLEASSSPKGQADTLLEIAEDMPIGYEEELRRVARNIGDANERARALLLLEPILAEKRKEEEQKRNREMGTLEVGTGGIGTSFGGRKVETSEADVEPEVKPEDHPAEVGSQDEEAKVGKVAEEAGTR